MSDRKGGEDSKAVEDWGDDTVKEGYLQKSDPKGKNWKKR